MLVFCKEPDRLEESKYHRRADRSPTGDAFAPQPSLNMRAVLQLVVLDLRVRKNSAGSRGAHHLNERLLSTLKAAYQLNTSRLQLLNVLDVQTSVERVGHVAHARRDGMSVVDLRKLEMCMAEVRRTVMLAGEAWNQFGPAFTRLTRLLPVQLEEAEPFFEPIECVEMERLALLCTSTLHGLQAPSVFSEERARYQRAVTDVALASAKVARANNSLRAAENGFRMGTREAHEFASALMEHSQQRRELMQKTVRACIARHTLYALAELLPEQFGLQ